MPRHRCQLIHLIPLQVSLFISCIIAEMEVLVTLILCISIQIRQTDSDSGIIVEDNCSEFESATDYEPHTALANIRQRLEMMCGGKITIRPR